MQRPAHARGAKKAAPNKGKDAAEGASSDKKPAAARKAAASAKEEFAKTKAAGKKKDEAGEATQAAKKKGAGRKKGGAAKKAAGQADEAPHGAWVVDEVSPPHHAIVARCAYFSQQLNETAASTASLWMDFCGGERWMHATWTPSIPQFPLPALSHQARELV